MRRAPPFTLPGDEGSPYQPAVQIPQPFIRQEFTLNDVTNLNPAAHEAVMKIVNQSNLGWFRPFDDGKKTIYFGIHGGAEWTGAAADPAGRLYVTATELPWIEGVYHIAATPMTNLSPEAQAGHKVYSEYCAACHGAELKGFGVVPSLIGLSNRMKESGFRNIMKVGRNAMRPQPQLSPQQVTELCDFLLPKPNTAAAPPKQNVPMQWADMSYTRLLDPQSYPGCTPPWGTLNCIDLNTGMIAWKVPLGEYPELKAKGIPKTGTENFGGATVTAGGVVFAGGTRDNQFRAFDADTGEELWKHDLPLHSTAPPAVYQVHGREYVVLPVTGSGKLGGPAGDEWMAFALPE
jgi:quinoprotein glucose dehydrogenase